MKELIVSVLLFLVLFTSSAYGDNANQSQGIALNLKSLMEFASSYPIEYNKLVQLSDLSDSYRDYKINGTYAFFLYKEGPFNVEITVFKDGIVLDYIPKRYGISYKEISVSYDFNESYQKLIRSRSAYINMLYTQYGMKFKRSKFDKEKLIETLIVFPNNTINTNPKNFASKIAEDDFKFDLETVMDDKLDKICDPYVFDISFKYPDITSKCIGIQRKIDFNRDYGVGEFEHDLQEINGIQSKLEKPLSSEEDLTTKILKFSKTQEEKYGSLFWLGSIVFTIIFAIIPIIVLLYLIITKGWKGAKEHIKEHGKKWLEEKIPILRKGEKQ